MPKQVIEKLALAGKEILEAKIKQVLSMNAFGLDS